MDEKEMSDAISQGIIDYFEDEDFDLKTYEEEGLLTGDSGLVFKSKDGNEFQITIKQIASPDNVCEQ